MTLSSKKPTILLTNDDGINAPGILQLFNTLKKFANVTLIAPLEEKSGTSHSITFLSPIRIEEVILDKNHQAYGINGTPVDCVKIGVHQILKKRPDLIISGINHGPNTSTLIFYSGTVSAAMEGAILGIPSIAVSLASFKPKPNFKFASAFTLKLIKKVLVNKLPKHTFLNVNIPRNATIDNIEFTKQNTYCFKEYFLENKDTRNQPYYWMGMDLKEKCSNLKNTDTAALNSKKISITPIKCDVTDYECLKEIKHWTV